eukprot:TRINITY_DN7590_c0_g1_i3.p1 TRINITY_DN7590_c0_g1~~TRINITY_DN7590_c0_g1_i3.p1  ORF type:complete len:329 (+),score=23.35 TRINITY_DN7590_c0_g1_i3:96-989(+)
MPYPEHLHRYTSKEIYSIVPNLRDIGSVDESLRKYRLYRGSQVYDESVLETLQLNSLIDLRRSKACGCCKPGSFEDLKFSRIQSNNDKLLLDGSCVERKSDQPIKVYKICMLPKRLKLWILLQVPRQVKYKLLQALCKRSNPDEVMAPAVADPDKLGFRKLYIAMLEKCRRAIRQIMTLCADESNYPMLIHCVHGKDRTGLIIMLLLMLCGVEREAIVEDYARSEKELSVHKTAKKLNIQDYLLEEKVICADQEYIRGAINHIETKYGSAQQYLLKIGVGQDTIQKIISNLRQQQTS